jgi:hypothetical protein
MDPRVKPAGDSWGVEREPNLFRHSSVERRVTLSANPPYACSNHDSVDGRVKPGHDVER